MSYRTILVHLNDSRRARKLLRHAVEIARAFEARLIGLHVSPTFHGRVVDPDYPHIPALEGLKFSRDEEADHLRAIFDEFSNGERFGGDVCRFNGEFHLVTAEHADPTQIVVARARAADLIIASQADREWRLSSLLDCSDRIAIESGRPVLMVPNANKSPALPKMAIELVAWKDLKERCRVRRFWAHEAEEIGHVVHKRGNVWAFHYDIHGDESHDESGFRFDSHAFLPGEYVSIKEQDGALRTCRLRAGAGLISTSISETESRHVVSAKQQQ